MCLQTKSSHFSKERDCTTLCNSFIVLFEIYIYIYIILIYFLLFSASIGFGELSSSSLFLASKLTCILCPMHLLSVFLINLLLALCILRYALLLDVLIDICFVFTMYLINLADTNIRYSGYYF